MQEMWKRDRATVREVLDALTRGRKRRAYTTVMTVMGRLERKGLLERERVGRTDVYRSVFSRDEYLDARARIEVEGLVESFGELALAHFARQMARLDRERLASLRKLARGDR